MDIHWSARAGRNLVEIRKYIAAEDPQAAAHVAERLSQAVELLAGQAQMGRPGRVPGTRELVITGTPYVVAYAVTADSIEVIAVLHGNQKWPDSL